MSFPDQAAQVTRGQGQLSIVEGATGLADARDAYCIRIDESFFFRATTDPNSHPEASATFDTRLFLFDEYGWPVLANDDSSAGGTTLSTLERSASDGSGFELEQRGRYTLVVAGAADSPQDVTGADLFDFGAGGTLTHSPATGVGAFAEWQGGVVETGSYSLALEGAKFCQETLSAVFTTPGDPDRVCRLEGGALSGCADRPDDGGADSQAAAFGYFDSNAHLDLVVALGSNERDQICAGSAQGLVLCVEASTTSLSTHDVAVRDLDGDSILDAVFAHLGTDKICYGDGGGLFVSCDDIFQLVAPNASSTGVAMGHLDGDAFYDVIFSTDGVGELNYACLGDGLGNFDTCEAVGTVAVASQSVALGRVDEDLHLDAVVANALASDEICLGLGDGTFTCSSIDASDTESSFDVELGFVDGDQVLDAVFARGPETENLVCLGDGLGGFTCSQVSFDDDDTAGVALGFVDDDPFLDAVFAGDVDRICLGDGSGDFTCAATLAAKSSPASTSVILGPLADSFLFGDGFESGDLLAWTPLAP